MTFRWIQIESGFKININEYGGNILNAIRKNMLLFIIHRRCRDSIILKHIYPFPSKANNLVVLLTHHPAEHVVFRLTGFPPLTKRQTVAIHHALAPPAKRRIHSIHLRFIEQFAVSFSRSYRRQRASLSMRRPEKSITPYENR